jgi:hypothetical protein
MTAFILSSVLLGLAMVQVSHLDRDSPTSTLTVGLERLLKKVNAKFSRVFVRSHETICRDWRGTDKDRNPMWRMAG